jgi:hypothetical protein
MYTMPEANVRPGAGAWMLAFTLVAPLLILSLTEVTARSVWQYGFGGLAVPLGVMLALLVFTLHVAPALQRSQARSLAHWLAQRSYPWMRRPLAALLICVDLTLLSLLAQTLTMLIATHTAGDSTYSLAAILLLGAGLFAVPQSGTIRWRTRITMSLCLGTLALGTTAVWMGIKTPIDIAIITNRTPPLPDSLGIALTFTLATLVMPAMYRTVGNTATIPRRAQLGALLIAAGVSALSAYMAAAGVGGADPLALRSAPSLLLGLQSQTLAPPLYVLVVVGMLAGSFAAIWVVLDSLTQSFFDDLIQLRGSANEEFLPRALLAVGALLAAQLVATGDSILARAAIGITSFGVGTLVIPLLYATRAASTRMALTVAWVVGAVVWISAVVQQSPGDPALWSAGAAAIYASMDWMVSALRGTARAHN